MKMLLTASGLINRSIVGALAGLLDRPFADASVAIVPTASLVVAGDKSWDLESIDRVRALGWASIDIVDLNSGPVALVEERLRAADVIYVAGGNHYYLAHIAHARGLQRLIRELLESKVYVGESAGSMIFTPSLAAGAAAMLDQADMDSLGIPSVEPVVDLFDWYFKPHLGSPSFPDRTDEWAFERARQLGVPVWFVDDDTALLVDDPTGDPAVVSEGRWLRFGEGGIPI